MLLTVKIAVGSGSSCQHVLHGAVAADPIDRRPEDEVVRVGDAGGLERLPIALQAVAASRHVVGVGEVRDLAMTDADQMFGQLSGTRDAVADDEVAIDVRQRAIEEHDREARAQERQQGHARAVAGRRQEKSFNAMLDEVVDILALQPKVGLAVAEEHAVAGLAGGRLGSPDHGREERVDDIGHDQPDRLRLLRNEASRDTVRHVVEIEDRALDTPLRVGVDARASIDDARHRHCRNAGVFRHVAQCDCQSPSPRDT